MREKKDPILHILGWEENPIAEREKTKEQCLVKVSEIFMGLLALDHELPTHTQGQPTAATECRDSGTGAYRPRAPICSLHESRLEEDPAMLSALGWT